ncbi:hypothetical protein [Marinobacterium iners]|uniref:Uncharacterized protein n=1 Tax=Marinobacterium iners DSM 11526 TaxID=1122198 RepID=A0A1H3ZFI5_9GAMM|nr:hypothetical protein [Marinobacterium iners]SEA22355.1 hypothetical protein SAMN02745729_10220 [Marinobacterium iners DSM 11526]
MLKPGDRVWVNIPGTGYVGVAKVTDHPVVADEFLTDGKSIQGQYFMAAQCGEDDAEYFVPVHWLHKVSVHEAVNEVGLFGNQNSVARPRTPKWEHTVTRLKELWGIAG